MSAAKLCWWFAIFIGSVIAGGAAAVGLAALLPPEDFLAGAGLGAGGALIGGLAGILIAWRVLGDPTDLP